MNKNLLGLTLAVVFLCGSVTPAQVEVIISQDLTREVKKKVEKVIATINKKKQVKAVVTVKGAKAVKKKVAAVKKAAAQLREVAQARQRAYNRQVQYRANVDRKDPTERFLVLTRQGVVLIEAAIHVDGKPFREARAKMIDTMLKSSDRNKDGKVQWDEAVKSPRFHFGRIASINRSRMMPYIYRTFDMNKNKVVERGEAEKFVAMYFQDSFSVTSQGTYAPYAYSYYRGGTPRINSSNALQTTLDADRDGNLSADELAKAVQRLKAKDDNDDDVIVAGELTAAPSRSAYSSRVQARRGRMATRRTLAIRLNAGMNDRTLHAMLLARYGAKSKKLTKKAFADQAMFASLDANKDGQLSVKEAGKINKVNPNVKLEFRLDRNRRNAKLALGAYNKDVIRSVTTGDRTVSLELGLTTVKFSMPVTANARRYDYSRSAKQMMRRYDKDKNKYLDKKESPRGMLARWDLDGDGKVFVKEITEAYNLQMLPTTTQVRAIVRAAGDPLFAAADKNKDNRLSARELINIGKNLARFDANKDGAIGASEVPNTINVTVSTGSTGSYYQSRVRVRRQGRGSRVRRGGATQAPAWFTSMDRNSDGDVTLREFLGNEKQFKKLDKNKDGFIDRQEAKDAE